MQLQANKKDYGTFFYWNFCPKITMKLEQLS